MRWHPIWGPSTAARLWSGGVSPLGLGATLAGGLVIGAVAAALSFAVAPGDGPEPCRTAGLSALVLLLAGAAGGLVGSLVDSLLGATVQVMYFSPRRGKETEKRVDPDGTPNDYRRGLRWVNNDVVNLVSSAVGGAAAVGLHLLLGG